MGKFLVIGILVLFLLTACFDPVGGDEDIECCLFEDTIEFSLAPDSPSGAILPGGDRVLMAIDVNCKQESCWLVEMTFDFSANPDYFYQFWLEDAKGRVISENIFTVGHSPWICGQPMVFNLSYTVWGTRQVYLVAPLYQEDLPISGTPSSFQPIMTGSVSDAMYGAPDLIGSAIYADF